MLNSTKARILLAGALAFGLAILLALLFTPLNPEGRFRVDSIGNEGPAFWQCEEGHVWLYVADNDQPPWTYQVSQLGTYYRTNGMWVFEKEGRIEATLHPTLFRLRWNYADGSHGETYTRMWLPP